MSPGVQRSGCAPEKMKIGLCCRRRVVIIKSKHRLVVVRIAQHLRLVYFRPTSRHFFSSAEPLGSSCLSGPRYVSLGEVGAGMRAGMLGLDYSCRLKSCWCLAGLCGCDTAHSLSFFCSLSVFGGRMGDGRGRRWGKGLTLKLLLLCTTALVLPPASPTAETHRGRYKVQQQPRW